MSEEKYVVRIKPGDYGFKWYSESVTHVFVVTIPANPVSGYLVTEPGKDENFRWIAREDAELLGRLVEGSTPTKSNERGHAIALAQSMAELRRKVDELATHSSRADYKAGQALTTSAQFADRLDALGELYDTHADSIDMLTDDIVLLDERTQPLTREGVSELSAELAKVVTKTLTEAMRNGR